MKTRFPWIAALLIIALISSVLRSDEAAKPFGIQVVDGDTGRGVPLVILESPDRKQYVTDSAGYIAVDEQGLAGNQVHFKVVTTHGYDYATDGFGIRGKAFVVTPGQIEQVKLERQNIAQRLYRTTGSGIYQHAIKLGLEAPIEHPLLNAQVAGSDSVLSAIYHNQIYWFWGDTNRMSYPLGNLHTTAARSPLPGNDVLPLDRGINYEYFVRDDGFVKPVAKMPGEGPTWLSSVTVFKDEGGSESLYAIYTKIRNHLDAYEWGAVKWNDEKSEFEQVTSFGPVPKGGHSQGHTFRHADVDGQSYIYFANPIAMTRVKDDPADFTDPTKWQRYTPLVEGTNIDDRKFDRNSVGQLVYTWKTNTPSLSQADEQKLIAENLLKSDEALLQFRDAKSGRSIMAHSGSTAWNAYRQKWIAIFVEIGGQHSNLGEVWYAESDAPQGPWRQAVQILTHERYDFYNPKHHWIFDEEGGRVIYFEGSYTNTFSGNPIATPQYEYNQILYKLELDDPRLELEPSGSPDAEP